jgi:hypothetical protein
MYIVITQVNHEDLFFVEANNQVVFLIFNDMNVEVHSMHMPQLF